MTIFLLITLFSVHYTNPLGRDASTWCSRSRVSYIVLSDICGLGILEVRTHSRRVSIPLANLLFLAGVSGGCFGLSGTYHNSIFLDSTKCRAVSAFSVWKRYWSTSL